MAVKKQKRGKKTKRKYHRTFLIIPAILLVSIIALFLLNTGFKPSTPTPIFEEAYQVRTDLHDEIGRVENAIYESLYLGKIPHKNILFPTVKPMHKEGYDWDFTEIIIRLPDRSSVLQLKSTLDIELSPLRPVVVYETEEVSSKEIVFHISALGFHTHKIRLIRTVPRETSHKTLPKIAIIIDDLGYDRKMAEAFIQIDLPISLSLLPLAPFTQVIANEANKKGCELLLHLPMEPKGYPSLNPGPGALLTCMDDEEIRRLMDSHLNRISWVKGVNNHMGSCFTEREDKVVVVLNEIKRRNLFFVDSRTTSKSVAFRIAKKMGIPTAGRSVFLDNDLSKKALKFQMDRLLGMARHTGSAIGIGHPNQQTINLIREYLNIFKTQFVFVYVSKLVS